MIQYIAYNKIEEKVDPMLKLDNINPGKEAMTILISCSKIAGANKYICWYKDFSVYNLTLLDHIVCLFLKIFKCQKPSDYLKSKYNGGGAGTTKIAFETLAPKISNSSDLVLCELFNFALGKFKCEFPDHIPKIKKIPKTSKILGLKPKPPKNILKPLCNELKNCNIISSEKIQNLFKKYPCKASDSCLYYLQIQEILIFILKQIKNSIEKGETDFSKLNTYLKIMEKYNCCSKKISPPKNTDYETDIIRVTFLKIDNLYGYLHLDIKMISSQQNTFEKSKNLLREFGSLDTETQNNQKKFSKKIAKLEKNIDEILKIYHDDQLDFYA